MLPPTQNFYRVEVSGILCGNSPGICLSSDLHLTLIIGKTVYVFYEGIGVEGVQIQGEKAYFRAAESNKLRERRMKVAGAGNGDSKNEESDEEIVRAVVEKETLSRSVKAAEDPAICMRQ